MTTQYLFAGFGGQGILFAGKLLAYKGLTEGKNVSWLPSYGPEMRGGTCNCSVNIEDEPVGSPLVTEPDILVAFNKPSFEKFCPCVKPGGSVFIDSSLISDKCTRNDIKAEYIPATALADSGGFVKLANVIMLGYIIKATGFCDLEIIEKALKKCISPRKQHLLPKNMEAVGIGYALD